MADDADNDDQWLYGDNPDAKLPDVEDDEEKEQEAPTEESAPENDTSIEPPPEDEGPPGVDEDRIEEKEEGEEDGEVRQNGDDSEKDDDEDDSDDDVNVVIGDIKATAPYAPVNIKRGGLLTSAPIDKNKQGSQQTGKFNVDEFEQIGTINGVPANEYNLDSLEDKPWRKPGADITDYFNYGFNEDTWKAYCERQKRIRVNESGTGLAPMNAIGLPRGPMPIMNDNSKYSGNFIGGPPPRNVPPPLGGKPEPQKISTIQVMTADRREYSRKPGFPDMSVPPPNSFEEFQPEYGFNPEPEPFYGGYEPTQDSQWGGPPMGPPPHIMGPPLPIHAMHSPGGRRESPRRDSRDRERDREVSRSRSEKPRDRERERSHRRERSRSKSRRHRSRSRSPSHRSHRKKKSRRHEDSE